jgi:hypothetical protein
MHAFVGLPRMYRGLKAHAFVGLPGMYRATKAHAIVGLPGMYNIPTTGDPIIACAFKPVISFRCLTSLQCIVISNVSSADRKTKLTLMLTEH